MEYKINIISEYAFCQLMLKVGNNNDIYLHEDNEYLLPEIEKCIEKLEKEVGAEKKYLESRRYIPQIFRVNYSGDEVRSISIILKNGESFPIILVGQELFSKRQAEIFTNMLSSEILLKIPIKKLVHIEKQKLVYKIEKKEPYLGNSKYVVYFDQLLSSGRYKKRTYVGSFFFITMSFICLIGAIITGSVFYWVATIGLASFTLSLFRLMGVANNNTAHGRYTEIHSLTTASGQKAESEIRYFLKQQKEKQHLNLIIQELQKIKSKTSKEVEL